MSANIKLSQAQLFQISKSGGRFGVIQQLRELGNFGKLVVKKAIKELASPLTKDVFPKLTSSLVQNAATNEVNKTERETSWQGAKRAEIGFNLLISIGDMNDFAKIVQSLGKIMYIN